MPELRSISWPASSACSAAAAGSSRSASRERGPHQPNTTGELPHQTTTQQNQCLPTPPPPGSPPAGASMPELRSISWPASSACSSAFNAANASAVCCACWSSASRVWEVEGDLRAAPHTHTKAHNLPTTSSVSLLNVEVMPETEHGAATRRAATPPRAARRSLRTEPLPPPSEAPSGLVPTGPLQPGAASEQLLGQCGLAAVLPGPSKHHGGLRLGSDSTTCRSKARVGTNGQSL